MTTTLPKNFTKNGFNFTCLGRRGQVALYQRNASSFNYQDFEIVRVRNYHFEKENKTVEVYPSSNEWGQNKFGISKVKKEEAEKEFDEWAEKFEGKEAEIFDPKNDCHKRGRKCLPIKLEFPEGEWGIRELADKHGVSIGYITNHLKNLLESGEVIKVESRKLVSGRGRKQFTFKYVGKK